MHYCCLIAVKDIPKIDADSPFGIAQTAIDQMVKTELEDLYKRKEQKGFITGMRIGELHCIRNAFSRSVCEKIGEIMDATAVSPHDSKYIEFFDIGEAEKEHFETARYDCVKTPDGMILPIEQCKFEIIDGLVYEKNVGPLHHSKRIKKAKKMKAYPNYPLKRCFKSYDDYLKSLYLEYDEEHQSYGWYGNPDAFWDWYSVGGRWPTTLLVPDSCSEYGVGEREERDEDMPPAPEGYKWAVMARKKDIAWDVMYKLKLKEGMERFCELKAIFEDERAACPYGTKTEEGILNFTGMEYIMGESMYENLKRLEISSNTKYHAVFYAFFNEDRWVFNENDDDPNDEYIHRVDQFIDSQDDDTVFVTVDCHV